jgi:DNA adenine methylase
LTDDRRIITWLVVLKRPFLKWAGAKTKLVSIIRSYVPKHSTRLIEPFVGSGAVGLNLGFQRNVIADSNADLISLYRLLKRDGETFVDECEMLFCERKNHREQFYVLREEFNSTEDRRRKAALFVYLNRHVYNGLCRYNSRGEFNVPFGRYTSPHFPRAKMIAFSAFLRRCRIEHSDFRKVMAEAGKNDFVYCDPPYAPASATANFTAYAKTGFGPNEQKDLAECCRAARDRGAFVLLSNHDTPETRKLYRGAQTRRLLVARRISCDGANRGHAKELLAIY